MDKPTCNADTAMRQAAPTVDLYFAAVIKNIDNMFGDGYAKKNPELVGHLVQAAASDFNYCAQTSALFTIAEQLESISYELRALNEVED